MNKEMIILWSIVGIIVIVAGNLSRDELISQVSFLVATIIVLIIGAILSWSFRSIKSRIKK